MTTSLSNPVLLPIAEVFTSIHGEGFWAGTPMTFIRLAGCTVGKNSTGTGNPFFPIWPDGHKAFMCTTFDGRTFPCDTDYRKTETLTVEDLLRQIPDYIRHVCITGGEPLMHGVKLLDLVYALLRRDIQVHFESSGTILPPTELQQLPDIWWVCSPKMGCLPRYLRMADELRVMVDGNLRIGDVRALLEMKGDHTKVYFAPLSSPHSVTEFDPASMQAALDFVKLFPDSRISIQMHKVLGVR